jgi:hypothetical protein
MELYINLTELETLGLSPTLYCYLCTLHFEQPYNLASDEVKSEMNALLEAAGYLKVTEEGVVLRTQTAKLFEKGMPTDNSVDSWIDEWREIFPQGVKSGGRPVRGDKQGVAKKMKLFVKANPTITKEQIINATKQYVFDASLKNYSFIICADYFINKNGSSMLGAVIEDLDGKDTFLQQNANGGGKWHKEI